MRVLFLGDIVGRGARRALRSRLRTIRRALAIDLTIGNGENASGGRGIEPRAAAELRAAGLDVVTTGNHVWEHDSLRPKLDAWDWLLRPGNYAAGSPGRGWTVMTARDGTRVAVACVIGRVFLGPAGCPFGAADAILAALPPEVTSVIVDVHAEATAEKAALASYLDGRVSAVIGTHTHVPTADERILAGGTAFLTDAGMCGPADSILGMRREAAVARMRTQARGRIAVADGPIVLQGVLIDIAQETGRAVEIQRFQETFEA